VPASEPQIFQNITPEQYASLIQKAGASGIGITGNSGTAAQFGVEVTWDYVPEACLLTIQCLKTPFFLSPATIDAQIRTIVEETAGTA
jgi:hypothetical protein